MPDVKGLINDPEFQKLDMGMQKSTLGKLDPEFSTLSDGDFVKFRAGMMQPSGERNPAEKLLSETPFFQRSHTAVEAFKKGKYKDAAGNALAAGYELVKPEVETIGMIEGGRGVLGAGKALIAGKARPALGLATALGAGYAVDKGLDYIGAPWWVREGLAGAAAIAVGSKVSPESAAVLEEKMGQTRFGKLIDKYLGKPTDDKEAFARFEKNYGRKPTTVEDRELATAELDKIKKDIRDTVFKKPEVEKPTESKAGPTAGAKVTPKPPKEPPLAHQLYEQNHGKLPETPKEKVAAVREMRGEGAEPKEPKPTAGPGTGSVRKKAAGEPTPGTTTTGAGVGYFKSDTAGQGAESSASITPGLGARIGKQAPKQAPPGDLRRQIFTNAHDLGIDSASGKKLLRDLVEKEHGKRISQMSDAELDKVMRDLPRLAAKLKGQ
jgi:hypothetical protein